jgi:hypothetical protein
VRRPADERGTWGNVPLLLLSTAAGLLVVTDTDALSRSGHGGAQLPFWIGLLLIVVPIVWQVVDERTTRGQRIVLAVLAALALYGVKVVHDPFAFTFADEFVHQHNVNALLRTGELFRPNSILPITPFYPGLASITGAVASMTGLSTFAAGILAIGGARLVSALALFVIVERLFRSDRAAAFAVLLYAAVPNYLFFTAQFAYESVALPLALVVLAAIVRQRSTSDAVHARRWTIVAVVVVPGVVATHHLTAYALLATLVAISALAPAARWWSRRDRAGAVPGPPWAVLGAVVVLLLAWLSFAGRQTSNYLSPVITRAISQTISVLSREAPPRALFQPGGAASTVAATSPVERVVGFASVLLLAGALPPALVALRKRLRCDPVLLLLAVTAIAYLATFPLRFVPAAWETAARASEFLFVGVAAVLAGFAATTAPGRRVTRGIASAAVAVLVMGGVIAGWPRDRRLSSPYRVAVAGATIEPQGTALARWSAGALGRDNRIAAEAADARLLQLYGGQFAVAGVHPDVRDILHLSPLEPWMVELLRTNRFRYIAVDRRTLSADSIAGYFFAPRGSADASTRPPAVTDKFEHAPGAQRIFDSGDIVLYDIAALGPAGGP